MNSDDMENNEEIGVGPLVGSSVCSFPSKDTYGPGPFFSFEQPLGEGLASSFEAKRGRHKVRTTKANHQLWV